MFLNKLFTYLKCAYLYKSSTCYFHMKKKILADFEICINVPLNYSDYTRMIYGKRVLRSVFPIIWVLLQNALLGIGQCLIAKIQRRIQNPVDRLRWTFLTKYLTIFSRYLLQRKAQSEVFDMVLYTLLEYVHFVYIVYDQFVTVICFEGLYQRFEIIAEFGKVGFLLNYIKRLHVYFHCF